MSLGHEQLSNVADIINLLYLIWGQEFTNQFWDKNTLLS